MRRKSGHPKIDTWSGPIVASDEVGYGAWAGPLVVCAATSPRDWDDPRIRDSKLFSRNTADREREALFQEFSNDPRFKYALVVVPAEAVDRMGVFDALLYAHGRALREVSEHLEKPLGVVDGTLPVHKLDTKIPLVALPKGDQLVPECSLASILAKVTRDRMMVALDKKYPGYGWASNKGYGGNEAHDSGLARLGPCDEHRKSYAPIARIIAERDDHGEMKNAWELLEDDDPEVQEVVKDSQRGQLKS